MLHRPIFLYALLETANFVFRRHLLGLGYRKHAFRHSNCWVLGGEAVEGGGGKGNLKDGYLFLPGIGVGLMQYWGFVTQATRQAKREGKTLVLAEPAIVAMRLRNYVSQPRGDEIVTEVVEALDEHSTKSFSFEALAPSVFEMPPKPLLCADSSCFCSDIATVRVLAHSFGSILFTRFFRSQRSRVRSCVLVDPVGLCGHLPEVTHNFVQRNVRFLEGLKCFCGV